MLKLDRSIQCALLYFILFFIILTGLTSLFPIYEGGSWNFDWFEHYQISLFFAGQKPVVDISPIARTPLYNLIQAFFLSFTGYSFLTYQILNLFLSSLFIISFFFVAEDLFGFEKAKMITLFPLISPWFLHLSWYPWPKMLCVFFVLLSFHFYLIAWNSPKISKYFILSSFFAGIAYLTHPLALFSFIPLNIDALFLRKESLKTRFIFLRSGLIFILIVSPWYLYTALFYGMDQTVHASPMVSFQADQSRTFLPFFITRLHNMIFSVLPSHLFILIGKLLDGSLDALDSFKIITEIYYNSIGGFLTLTGFFGSIALFINYLIGSNNNRGESKFPLMPLVFLITFFFVASSLFLFSIHEFPTWKFYPAQLFGYLKIINLIITAFFTCLSLIVFFRTPRLEIKPHHMTAFLMIIVGFILGVLSHPGMDGHGVAHNAMTPIVTLISIYFANLLISIQSRWKWVLISGFILESFIGIWGALYFYSDVYHLGKNLYYKTNNNLNFIYDYTTPLVRNLSTSFVIILMFFISLYLLKIRQKHFSK